MSPIHPKIRVRLAATLRQHTAKLDADYRRARTHLLEALNLLIRLEPQLPRPTISGLRSECERLLGALEYVKERPSPIEIDRLAVQLCKFSEALATLKQPFPIGNLSHR
jgi:hypothetical protein